MPLKVSRQFEQEDRHLGFTPKEKAMKRHGKKVGSWGTYNKALHNAQNRFSNKAAGRRQDIERHRD